MEDEKVEETIEVNDSENVEEVSTDEVDDNTPTLEDYQELQKKNKELYERAKKAEAQVKAKKEVLESKKTNNETQSGLTREEAILYAKGYSDDEVQLANKLALVNGTTPLKAIEDEIFKAKVNQRLKKERAEKAALPSSSGGSRFTPDKPVGEMSEEEHRAYFNKVMGNQ